jgi:OPT family oligopeptide transporter
MSAPNAEEASTANAFPISTEPLSDPDAIAARDREWFEKVYKKDEAQLTVRAAITGMVLGSTLGAANLYIGLKIGWNFGMSITSSVLAFAIFSAAQKVFPTMRPFSTLENNTSQTAASAAAYMSSAGLVSSIPAMTILRREGMTEIPELTFWQLVAWLLAISALGVVVAIPLKRNMINAEQLRFPSGIVCAETIRTLHGAGNAEDRDADGNVVGTAMSREGFVKAMALLWGGVVAAVWKFVCDCKIGFLRHIPENIAVGGTLRGLPLKAWGFSLNTSLLLYAAGAIMGLKVTLSLAFGAVLNFAVIAPWLMDHGVLRMVPEGVQRGTPEYAAFAQAAAQTHAIVVENADMLAARMRSKWSVWPGTSLMVSASLVAFAFRWRMIARAFSGIGRMLRGGAAPKGEDALARVEVPQAWFGIGLLLCTVAAVFMQRAWFGVPVFEGVLSVAMAFLLSIVAARATGETDVTPIGAMGKITQLLFGVMVPGNVSANLMTATVTAGAASHSADLLTEVKTGYLLGGAPRKQFWAQLLGVLAGGFACVYAYTKIATPEKLGTSLPAPAAASWAGVAKLLKDGPSNLPPYAVWAIGVGAAVGALLAVADELAPKSVKKWLPSATGLGIAFVIDAHDSLAMLVGAVAAWLLNRYRKEIAERFTVSVSSGMVAGEGLMGIAIIVLREVLHVLPTE